MLEIQNPFGIKGIPLKPEMKGRLKVDETLIQSLAAIMGFDGEARRLLTCSLSGSLHTVTAPATSILNLTGVGANDDFTFDDIPVTEVMIRADMKNTGIVWVNIGAAASLYVGWPLDARDTVIFSLNNMKELQLRIVNNGDNVIIILAG